MKNAPRAKKTLDFTITSIKSLKDGSGDCVIAGYANTSSKDRVGDVVMPAAFEKTLPTYLKNPVLLANHDWNDPIGRVQNAEITDKGLYVEARISDTRGDIKTLVREKVLSTFSIGYNELDADFDESTKTKYIKELELLEISIVSVPANTEASFTEVTGKEDDAADGDAKAEGEKSGALDACLKDKIPKLIEEGYEQDQAVAIAYSECGEKGICTWKGKKTTKTKGQLLSFIETVKDALGGIELGKETVVAVGDYFNANEEIMTKDQLLALLRGKSAAAPGIPGKEKADGDQAGEQAKPAANEEKPADESGDALKQLMAKIDAIAQGLAQCLEKLDKLEQEEAAEENEEGEEKPADAEKPAKPEDKPSADDAEKADKPEATQDEDKDKEDDKEEMKDEDVEKSLAELDAQIAALEESVNG